MDAKTIVKSTQEQAVASWIGYLNQLRLENLLEFIQQQDTNLSDAMDELAQAMQEIQKLMTTNRGGTSGIHGFIAEVAEVGIGNARKNIVGLEDIYTWVDDNGVADLVRNGVDIQQKFYNSGLSLGAIAKHLDKYPDFLKNGGKYQIPKDQYDKIRYFLSLSKEEADRMPTSDGTFSLRQWKSVHNFFENSEIRLDDIEPSALEYKDVQVRQIDVTLQKEKSDLLDTDRQQRSEAQQRSKGSLQEGAKVTAIGAGIEGAMSLTMAVLEKKQSGKAIKDFDSNDWIEIFQKTGLGTAKGAVRGISTYTLTNAFNQSFVMTTEQSVKVVMVANRANATVASAMVTAAFGVAEQAHQYRKGEITKQQFIENAELLSLETSVSALSAFVGQSVIPVPVVGAMIGNAIGTTLYKIARDHLNENEQKIIGEYLEEIEAHELMLDEKYHALVSAVQREFLHFLEIVESLYAVDMKAAFEGSVSLAKYCGVSQDEILDTKEKTDAFFLD